MCFEVSVAQGFNCSEKKSQTCALGAREPEISGSTLGIYRFVRSEMLTQEEYTQQLVNSTGERMARDSKSFRTLEDWGGGLFKDKVII